jgi:phosphoserine aminotransferase
MPATASERIFNFSAGPGTLPLSVIEEVRDELPIYGSEGASILEVSHRGKSYTAVHEGTQELLRKLLGLGDDWSVLLLQGGASMQFHQVPLNLLREDASADYLDTGKWSAGAIEEARRIGRVNVAASSEADDYAYIPDPQDWHLDSGAAYLHYTSNNTIYGTQFAGTPQAEVPLVVDASSDFLSRPIDLGAHGLIYAGAQKNIGPAGVTVVLVRSDLLGMRKPNLPTMLDYGTHAAKLYNTPPAFAVYVVHKVLRWLDDMGGVQAIEAINNRKAETLYGRIDAGEFYRGTARPDSRSKMNVTFRLPSEELEAEFVAGASQNGMRGLKGHRSVGGVRASLYNAMPEAGVDALVSFMDEFERTRG